MDDAARAALEKRVEDCCKAGDHTAATTIALQGYGPELLGYLLALTRDEADASEVFSVFSEDLWRGIPNFRWQSSLRTWAYTLARNAFYRSRRDPARRPERRLPLSHSPEVQAMAEKVRTTTLVFLRTEVKDAVTELREALQPDEQTLLILRIDRRMSWRDIAMVLRDGEDDDDELKRLAATLRKRFERVKSDLKRLAKERGITD